MRHTAMRHRDTGHRGHRDRARDPWYDGPRHAGLRTRQRLFEAAAEYVRIAVFQPYDDLSLPAAIDEDPVDLLLLSGPAARKLRRVDQLHISVQLVQQRLRCEPVRDDHVGLGEQPPPANRDQVRVAWSPADEIHAGTPVDLACGELA